MKVDFLDISPYNEKEMADQYLKGCQYGAPMVSRYCASLGMNQAEMDSMNFLEVEILELPTNFVPLTSSAQMSSSSADDTNQGGRPRKDDTDLTDSGAQSREDGVEDGDWG